LGEAVHGERICVNGAGVVEIFVMGDAEKIQISGESDAGEFAPRRFGERRDEGLIFTLWSN
jgi:hypothetical protein